MASAFRHLTGLLVLTSAISVFSASEAVGSQSLCNIGAVDWLADDQRRMLDEFELRAKPFEIYARRQQDRMVARAFDGLTQRRQAIAFDKKHPARGVLSGNYQCRKIQTDSSFGVSYPFFRCRIQDDGEGSFEVVKVSGSQLFTGILHRVSTVDTDGRNEGHLVYQGMYHSAGEEPQPWDAYSPDAQVGCMTARRDGTLVLELPPQRGYASHVLWEFQKR